MQLGLGFCLFDSLHITETIKDLYLFVRNLTFKFIFDKDCQNINLECKLTERTRDFTMEKFHALRDVILLYDEGATEDPSGSQQDPMRDLSGTTAILAGSSLMQPTVLKKLKPKPWFTHVKSASFSGNCQ